MQKPTATEINLQGVALIEASAGTGKTWTLTGIILRLIVEDERRPEEIVATTFTRAAAAEMRRRIYARLSEFHQLLSVLEPLCNADNWQQKCEDCANENWQYFSQIEISFLKNQITLKELQRIASDKINQHLIEYLASQDEENAFQKAIARTKLAIDDIDRFFIGTLDSLCQRWLYEYALDTGATDVDINEDSPVIRHVLHDLLREYYQQQAVNDPELFAAYYQNNKKDSQAYVSLVKSALSYQDAIIDPVELTSLQSLPNLSIFSQQDIEDSQQLLLDGKKFLNGNLTICKNAEVFTTTFYHCRNQEN